MVCSRQVTCTKYKLCGLSNGVRHSVYALGRYHTQLRCSRVLTTIHGAHRCSPPCPAAVTAPNTCTARLPLLTSSVFTPAGLPRRLSHRVSRSVPLQGAPGRPSHYTTPHLSLFCRGWWRRPRDSLPHPPTRHVSLPSHLQRLLLAMMTVNLLFTRHRCEFLFPGVPREYCTVSGLRPWEAAGHAPSCLL